MSAALGTLWLALGGTLGIVLILRADRHRPVAMSAAAPGRRK